MARFIRSWFVVALLLGAAVPAFAQPTKKAPAADLALLPVDSDLVMRLNVQQLRSSALWNVSEWFLSPLDCGLRDSTE